MNKNMKRIISNPILVVAFFIIISITQGNAQTAYIPNNSSNNVTVINVANDSVIATIPVGINPFGASVSNDGTKVYITNEHDGTMASTFGKQLMKVEY
jgi:YVTN family beta-propeller protein